VSACTQHSSTPVAVTTAGSAPGTATAIPTTPAGAVTATSAPKPTLATLSKSLTRPLVLPSAAGYASAARLYNPRFDAGSHPAAIATCASAADVSRCVRYAADTATALHLRSGGHSYGGWSTGQGLVIDVGGLSSVVVDTASGTARIGAGARLAGVYSALAAQGAALAAGSCPTVGVTGLALGGGVGALTRAYGLTCDAIQSVQIVTADGKTREVSATVDPDLFWALRGGGGGSFGAVTAFTVKVRPAPTVHTFYLQWPFARAGAVLAAWQKWIATADPKLWSTCKLLADPTSNSLQATVSGTWIGTAAALTAQLAPLRTAVGAQPAADQASTLSYAQAMLFEAGCLGQSTAQCIALALQPPKRQPFAATSAILAKALPAAGIAAAVQGVTAGLSVSKLVEGGISFDALGGQVAAVPGAGSAFAYRSALATVQYTATWASVTGASGTADPAPFDTFVRGLRSKLAPWTGAAAYVNYADPAITDYSSAYWGSNYPRLQAVKKTYDPGQLFTYAQAVRL
jgi:FAD/FMN-containing dehydrogenase